MGLIRIGTRILLCVGFTLFMPVALGIGTNSMYIKRERGFSGSFSGFTA